MTRKLPLCTLAMAHVAGIASLALSGPAHACTGQQMSGRAKVGIAEARKIALYAQPGRITGEALEKESGGSGLQYSFDVKIGATTHEAGVDASTGTLLENSVEGPNAD